MEEKKNYLIRSVTSHLYTGEVVEIVGPHTVIVKDAAWIEDTGRLGRFLRTGKADGMAIEYCGPGKKAIHWAEWDEWYHELFKGDV